MANKKPTKTKTKTKNPEFNTPAGTAIFPYIHTPDTHFKEDGEYKVKLAIPKDAPGIEELIAKLDELYDSGVASKRAAADKAKAGSGKKLKEADKPYSLNGSDDEDFPDCYIISAKQNAKITLNDGTVIEPAPSVFDSKGKPLDRKKTRVGGGSTLKMRFEAFPFHQGTLAGLSLRLKAVQVLKLEVYDNNRDAEDFGFSSEEGFSDDSEADSDSDSSDDSGDEAGNGGSDDGAGSEEEF